MTYYKYKLKNLIFFVITQSIWKYNTFTDSRVSNDDQSPSFQKFPHKRRKSHQDDNCLKVVGNIVVISL